MTIKQEFLVFGTKQQLQKIWQYCNPGWLRNNLTYRVHAKPGLLHRLSYEECPPHKQANITSISFHYICSIRSHIDEDTAKIIIQALIMARLDYCSSALLGSAKYQLDKLQWIQNMACRVVRELRKYDHVWDNLKSLHWLNFKERIAYKVAMLVFKCKVGTAPRYLTDLINTSNPNKCILRSSMSNDIVPVFCKTSTAMKGSLASAGPRIWNSLPAHLKASKSLDTFKQRLETHLFTISYH